MYMPAARDITSTRRLQRPNVFIRFDLNNNNMMCMHLKGTPAESRYRSLPRIYLHVSTCIYVFMSRAQLAIMFFADIGKYKWYIVARNSGASDFKTIIISLENIVFRWRASDLSAWSEKTASKKYPISLQYTTREVAVTFSVERQKYSIMEPKRIFFFKFTSHFDNKRFFPRVLIFAMVFLRKGLLVDIYIESKCATTLYIITERSKKRFSDRSVNNYNWSAPFVSNKYFFFFLDFTRYYYSKPIEIMNIIESVKCK